MKKGLIFLIGLVSFLGINTVSADTTTVLSYYYNHFDEYIKDYNQYKDNIDHLISYWEENHSSVYPYYAVVEVLNGAYTSSTAPSFFLVASNENVVFNAGPYLTFSYSISLMYDSTTDTYDYNSSMAPQLINLNIDSDFYVEQRALISNGLVCLNDLGLVIPTFHSNSLNLTFEEIKLKKGINYPGLVELKSGTYNYNIDELAPELELEDVLSNPLDTLKDVKDTIVNIFNTITEFISLLPDTMRTFLYLSFTVAIVLGLLKIIL